MVCIDPGNSIKPGRDVKRIKNITFPDVSKPKKVIDRLDYATLDYVPNPIIVCNPDLSIIYVNPALGTISGYTQEDLVGTKSPYPFWSLADNLRYETEIQQNLLGENCITEHLLHRKNGEQVPIKTKVSLVKDNNKLKYIIVHWTDITGRKKMEIKLSESEAFKTSLLNDSPNPILVINRDGSIRYINPALEKLTGYSKNELLGRPFPPPWWPEDKVGDYHLQNISALKRQALIEERVFKKKNGEFFSVTLNMRLVEEQDKPRYYIANWVDTTERRKVEEQNKYQATLMDNVSDAVVSTDLSHNILSWNKAAERIYGWNQKEVLGKKIMDVVPQVYLSRSQEESLDGHLNKAGYWQGESTQQRRDGSKVNISSSVSRVLDNTGKAIGHVAVFHDTTEQRKAKEELKESEAKFRTLSEQSTNMIFINTGSRIAYVNQRCVDLLGYSKEEFYAPDFNFMSIMAPESRELVAGNFGRRQHGESIGSYEYVLITKDGKRINTIISMNQIEYEKEKAFLGSVTDITEYKKMEEQIRYQAKLVDNVSDAIISSDLQSHILSWNKAAENIYGWKQEEVLGKGINEILTHENLMGKHHQNINKQLTSTGKWNGESFHRRRDGIVLNVHSSICQIKDSSGNAIGNVGIYRDITDQLKAESILKESEAKFRSLAEQSPDMIVINQAGKLVYANKKCEEVTGYKREELYSRDFDFLTLVCPEFKDKLISCYRRLVKGDEVEPLEFILSSKDGKKINVLSSTKLIDYEGEKAILATYTDLSLQKQAEEKLRLAAQEWRTTFDSITDMIVLQDKEGKIIRMNMAFANKLHKRPQELIGLTCCEVIGGIKGTLLEWQRQQVTATNIPVSAEFFDPSLDIYIQGSSSAILDEAGEYLGAVVVLRDITEYKRLAEQLMMTDRLATIGELTTGLAHELNNPLTSVIGFSQLMLEGEVPPEIMEDLKIINSESQRAAKIIKNLLTFGRKHQPVKQLNQINDCIDEVLSLRAYEHKGKNIKVIKQLDNQLLKLMFDYFQIQQVFINLVVNAEFFMSEAYNGGNLTVKTEMAGGIIRASVTDDGPGITPENLKHLFNPFFTTKEVGKGTGLGLAICHGIVSEHGGNIYAESRLGRGATFIVELPLCQQGNSQNIE